MKPNLRTIASTTIAILFLAPLILSIAPIQAQFVAATITSVSSSAGTGIAVPGEPVTITINVAMSTTVNVYLCADSNCNTKWASTWFVPPTPGQYTVSLTLPLSLPNAVDSDGDGMVDLYVVVEALGVRPPPQMVPIAPKVVVAPIETADVNMTRVLRGEPDISSVIKVFFYGYLPYDTITTIQFKGPITVSYTTSLSVNTDGTASTTVRLLDLQNGEGLPRGSYTVVGIAQQTNISKARNATLTIIPQVIIKPNEGHGRCDSSVCELQDISIVGYGFDPNVAIVKIVLHNINFTKVNYTFTMPGGAVSTTDNGYFQVRLGDLSNFQDLKTNMTAGLYIPIVYEAPAPKTFSNTSNIPLGQKGEVFISQSTVSANLNTRASIRAASFVNGTLGYITQSTKMTYTKTEVLRIDITENGKNYMLTARLVGNQATFALYNMSVSPPVELFNVSATPSYDGTFRAYVANLSFNIVPLEKEPLAPEQTGQPEGYYKYWARFLNYTNYIYLELRMWGLDITYANLTIVYSNADTGRTVKSFYELKKVDGEIKGNMTLSATTLSIEPLTFRDADIDWKIEWRYDVTGPQTGVATLTVTGQPTKGPSFDFKNAYYIVRPLLVLVAPTGIIKPGDTVTIAAYGYGPGSAWGYPGYNSLNVYWEKILKLATVSLGNDGNATFQVTIPSDASFGVHYIWGVDLWDYEYSLAIIIGAKAYWTIVYPPPFTPTKIEPKVSASYNGKRVEVCPCPQTVIGLSYCDKCVAYGGRCDYLGDNISVTLSGVSVGETITVYFGGQAVKTVKANESVVTIEFVVPTVPQGTYQLFAVGSVSGTIYVTMFYNGTTFIGNETSPVYPQVVPKLLLLDLNKNIAPILVGQGIVRVLGTGFPPGASVLAMLINNTDAGYSMNLQVQRWGSDSRGVLINTLSPDITPGIYVPVLEPGAYAISLLYVMPNATQTNSTMPGYVYVINNVSRLVDKDYFNNAVNSLSNQMSSVVSAVSDAKATLTAISSTLQQLSSAVSSGFDSISKKIDSAQSAITSAVTSVSNKVDAVSSSVNAVSSKIDSLSSKVDSVSSAVSDMSSKVSTLDSAISKLQDAIGGVNSAVQQLTGLSSKVDSISSAVSTLSSKVDTLTSAVNSVSSKVDNVASKVDSAANSLSSAISGVGSKVDTVSGKVDNVASKVDTVSNNLSGKIDSATSTLQTYIIITLVLALIAAATSIYAAIQLGRKLAA